MTLSINVQKTWAILIGTGTFHDPNLPAIPAVKNNLAAMRRVLIDESIVGIPSAQILEIENVEHLYPQLIKKLEQLPKLVETLLIYYSGHGFRHDNDVYLAATNSTNNDAKVGSLPFADLWNKTNDRATHNVLYVLDCCFSGDASRAIAQRGQKNIALLTASSPEDTAKAEKSLTVFTQHLIELLEQGHGNQPVLTLGVLYETVRERLISQGYPKPAYTHLMSEIHFFKNRAYQSNNINKFWQMPPRNSRFTGRVEFLKQLEETLSRYPLVAVTSFGGVGKTQTAIEYAYQQQHRYRAVLWVSAESEIALDSGLAALAPVLQLPKQTDQHANIAAVKSWLLREDQWLLILDNADGAMAEAIVPLCRELTSHGRRFILVTSQRATLDTRIHSLPLKPFSIEEGTAFLLQATARQWDQLTAQEQTAVRQLGDAVDWLPLLLDVMAESIHVVQCGFHYFYTELYQPILAKLLDTPSADHPKSMLATFRIAFTQIQAAHPQAMEILWLCAFLAGDAIPETVFSDMDKVLFNKAIAVIVRYSLVHRNTNKQMLSMHRSVQWVLRQGLAAATQREYAERAVKAVNRAFPEGYVDRLKYEPLLPCGLQCVEWIKQWEMVTKEAGRLLNKVALILLDQNRYPQAESLLERGLAIQEQLFGKEDVQITESLNNLANVYLNQRSNYKQALLLCKRALKIQKKVLGAEHHDVAVTLNNLANVYSDQGKYKQALRLHQCTLKIREKALGPEHLYVAVTLNNLADIYFEQGNYEQALSLHQRALAIREKALGAEHPDVATSLNNLAFLYFKQGDYNEAKKSLERALTIQEEVLGTEHPDVALTLCNLAWLYQNQGDLEQAKPLFERALAIFRQKIIPNYRWRQDCEESYAKLLEKMV